MKHPLFPKIHRGDSYYMDFGNKPGSTVHGIRPAMVVQNNVGNRHSPKVIVAAITTEIKKTRQPTHVQLGSQFGLPQESMLMLEQLTTIDKVMLRQYIGAVDEAFMKTVDRALSVSVGIYLPKRKRRRNKICRPERPVIASGT